VFLIGQEKEKKQQYCVLCLRGMMLEEHILNRVRLDLTPFSDSLKIKVRKSKMLNAMQE